MTTEGTTGPTSDGDSSGNVVVFIDEARRYVLAEDERSRTFQGGATTLVAAIGVVLSISLALGDRLRANDLFLAGWLTDSFYVLGIGLLIVAGGFAVAAVFPPAVDTASLELMALRRNEPISTPLETTRSKLLKQLTIELGQGKLRNLKARRRLEVAAPVFAAGALVIAFLGTTIAVSPKHERVTKATSRAVSSKSKKGERTVTRRTTTTRSSP